ncbi:WYL domain-containing protein [Sphingosinicella sp. LHD-64]|uniref:helix-turn-helix transcriptional regulator n=1 Tax=Sphingosinicella sp. LHD-64 TaxID=3072139 RepID=UPI0028108FB9|nr:WYL domain-containing protein [Sphingosinicella sp. LHD-64]MDQ8755127.1 WYL domain-containing protein [Sphingosinicella sp. LHD-64]
MRASRLLSILLLLQTRGRMTAQALADEFEVSVRTVYRDIDDLSAAGVPVYADRGRMGGFQLLDGYRTRLTGMTPAEAEALFLSGLPGPAAELGLGDAMAAAQLKLLAALPDEPRRGASRAAARIHLDPVAWYRKAEQADILPQLAAAVWNARRIRIRYESWTDVRDREVEPLGLVLKAGIWYLVAEAGRGPLTYRVAAIQRLDVSDERFERPADFDLAAYWTKWAAEFETRIYRGRATLRVSPAGYKLLALLGAAVTEMAAHTAGPPDAEGWVCVEIPVESVDHAASEVLRLGAGEAEVLAPPELRAHLAGIGARLGALYGAGREDVTNRAADS